MFSRFVFMQRSTHLLDIFIIIITLNMFVYVFYFQNSSSGPVLGHGPYV